MTYDPTAMIATILAGFDARITAAEGGISPGQPGNGPVFTAQPVISPSTGAAGTTFTATPGTATAPIVSRAWLLNGSSISTGLTAVPMAGGTLTYQEAATDANGVTTVSQVQTVTVSAAIPAPVFTVQPSISPTSGVAGATFTASDGSASNTTGYTRRWLLGGTSIGTGSTVVPVTAGALSLEVTATGPGGSTVATSAAVTVSAAPTPTPSPTLNALTVSPATATTGVAYSGSVTGRTADSTLSLTGAGAAGLTANNSTGAITGTPTTAGAVNVVETLAGATNSPRTSSNLITVAVASSLSIAGTPAPASVGTNGPFAPTITGGTAPYTLSLASGTLPPGRTINSTTRAVEGQYTTAGTYNYVLRATDSVGATADLTVNITVAATGTTDNIIVANRLQYPNDSQSLNSTNTARREHYASPQGAITNLRPQFMWNFLQNTGTTGSGAAASLKHTIEYPEGVFHPTMWGGVRELVTASNSNYIADVVVSSVTGQPLEIPAGAKFWERTVYISTSSKAFPTFSYPASVSALGVSDGKLAGDFADSGTIPADTTSTTSWGMTAIKGTVKATGARAVVVFGDSMTVGQGDVSGASAKGSTGMVSRKFDDIYPSITIARGGYYAQQFAFIATGTAFPNFIATLGATHVLIQAGLNDLSLGSRTAAQVMADRQSIIDMVTSRISGIAPVHTTITPRVNTTDNYASVANQTPKTDGNMADLTPLNALIRAKPLVMDYADAAMSARDSNVFSGPFPFSGDGTHLTTAKAIAVASAVNMPF